jgi:hypothetical protein
MMAAFATTGAHSMRLHAILLACLCAPCAVLAADEPPTHDHAAQVGTSAPEKTSNARWAADAPLHDGMRRVHEALTELRHHEMGHMSPDQAREQASAIERAVSSIFANCKLAPDADAALHGILVPLLAGAKRLHDDPADKDAIKAMRDAVADYPRHFDDPQEQAQPNGGAHAH